MVEDIGRIEPNLQGFRFGDSDCLTHRRIEVPLSRQFQRVSAKSASRSRLRVLQKNLACFGIRDSLQGAISLEFGRNSRALGIQNLPELISEEVPRVPIPYNLPKAFRRKRSDDIRHGAAIEACGIRRRGRVRWILVSRSDTHRLPGTQVDDKTCLPALGQTSQPARAVAQEQLARPEG